MDENKWVEDFLDKPFTELTLVFYLISILIICNLVYIIFLKNKLNAKHYFFFNTLFLTVICCTLAFKVGVLIDKFSMSGSSAPFYLTIGTCIGFLIHFFYYFTQKDKKE